MIKINESTLTFLSDLKKNNNKEWFAGNRSRYIEAKENFEAFIQAAINGIGSFDPFIRDLEVSSCTYRINRDIRFSSDKSIYKTHLGAFIVRGGKKNGDRYAGYYIHVEPGNLSMLAGGAYMPPAEWLRAIREKIDDQGDELVKIITDPEFGKYFGELEGEKLKTAPKGYPGDHKYIDLLKHKSYLVTSMISDDRITSKGCLEYITGASEAMKDLNNFLSEY